MAASLAARSRVLVVGGGIGGCTAALSLHRAGVDVALFERAPAVEAAGLGINLTPQAVKILSDLGLGNALMNASVQNTTMILAGNRGLTVWSEPRGLAAGNPYPQCSIHRGRLAQLLFDAVRQRLGEDAVFLGHEIVSVDSGSGNDDTEAVATFRVQATGETVTMKGDALVGCDGLASKVRKQFYSSRAKFTGWVCWRGCSEMDEAIDGATMQIMGRIQDSETGAILGGKKDAAFVCYPMDPALQGTGRMLLNWVAERIWDVEEEGDPGKEEYDQDAGREKVLDRFSDWGANGYNVRDIVEQSSKILQFPMYDRDPVDRWTFGRITLLGDAAHPMLPFGSQGAGQAILDAECIGRCFAVSPSDARAALNSYEAERLGPANAVVEGTRKGGDHMAFDIVRGHLAGRTDVNVDEVRAEILKAREAYSAKAGFVVAKRAKIA